MIVIDANLLLYAYDESSSFNAAAVEWLERVLSGHETIAIPWPSILAFMRISTNERVFVHPLSITEAVACVDAWLERSNVTVPSPGDQHWDLLKERLVKDQAGGLLVPDAHLAVLAMELGATLATSDRDFARFQGLTYLNPLHGN